MRIRRYTAVVFVSVTVFLLPTAIHAQGVSGGGVAQSIGASLEFGTDAHTGAPYTITFKTTNIQKLANGVTITHESTLKEARDSSGRQYHEQEILPGFTIVNINDPVNHTRTTWNSSNKQVTIFHTPDPENPPGNRVVHEPNPTNTPTRLDPNVPPQIEDLGTKTIQGLTANGKRITRTIKAGSEGNDLPFTTTSETWYSPDLNMSLLQINDDPRSGTNTREAIDVQRGEPDPSLFQIPEGYTVHDQYPGLQN